MTRSATAALGALLLAACATAGEARGPGNEGERLYRTHCASCHRLRAPGEHTREEWGALVFRYAPRAHLTEGEEAVVLRYLQERARP
jgi:mono/diheme cytochrome c family protein